MKFGKILPSQSNRIDFSLPEDPFFNQSVLTSGQTKRPKVYVGCARWIVPAWAGKIYPTLAKEKDYLEYYGRSFNAIELNATHYKLYEEAAIKKWTARVIGDDFVFCPKMYQGITHDGLLSDKSHLLSAFLKSTEPFGNLLGPVFIQLSENFSPGRKEELFTFLSTLPTDMSFFLEIRHPAWFARMDDREEWARALNQNNIGAVITDVGGRRDCAHMYCTIPKTFVRYVSDGTLQMDYARIDAWAIRIKNWIDRDLQEVYFFIHTADEIFAPELAGYAIDKFNAALGLQLRRPVFIPSQQRLFDE